MPKKVRPGSKRLPPWQTPQTQCRGSYSRKMSKKGVFEQAKDTFSPEALTDRPANSDDGGSPPLSAPLQARAAASIASLHAVRV